MSIPFSITSVLEICSLSAQNFNFSEVSSVILSPILTLFVMSFGGLPVFGDILFTSLFAPAISILLLMQKVKRNFAFSWVMIKSGIY